jgi:antitoxin ParD1/3/4
MAGRPARVSFLCPGPRSSKIRSRSNVMQAVNILLPDPVKEFVDDQIRSGRYHSADEYIRELILQDERRKAQGHLEALLVEGIEGEESDFTRQDFEQIRQEAAAELKRRKNQR